MPIYEFYCADCHTIFNFLSKAVNTSKRPPCPKCRRKLERQVSLFSMGGNSQEGGDLDSAEQDFQVHRFQSKTLVECCRRDRTV